jgi:NAD(P)-dependent dehydrogenase (short-subunit alcohol dehydrogenase family)
MSDASNPALTLELFRLDGQFALITGASRGLGRACALALAGAGADVALVGRTADELENAADDVRAIGRDAYVVTVDVTDLDAFRARIDELPPVDIFVNNAGTNKPQPFLEVDTETYDMMMAVNLRAAFFSAQAVAANMVARGAGGSIINMSSQAGHRALRDRTVYSTGKFGLEGLTKAMAYELAQHRIRVNAVAPTFVETPLTKPMLEQAEFQEYVKDKILLPRIGQLSDVAAAVLYLSAPASSMVTGTSLLVDGGWTAH